MKNLRKLAAISVILVLLFMIAELFQAGKNKNNTFMQSLQPEYYFGGDWIMVSLDNTSLEEPVKIKELAQKAISGGKYQKTKLPYKSKESTDDIMVFKNTLPEEYAGTVINFLTTDARIYVIAGGEVVCQYGFKEDKEKLYGTHENLAEIPDKLKDNEIWIMLAPSYPGAKTGLGNIKAGTGSNVVIGVIGNNISDIGCCLLIMIMAIILLVIALIRRYTCQENRGEVFLSFYGFAASTYCFIRTDTLNIFYNINEAYEMQEYLILLFPLFLALYFGHNMYKIYPRRFFALLLFADFNALIQLVLQVSGILPLEEITIISSAITGIICITVLVSLTKLYYKDNHKELMQFLAVFLLFSGIVAGLIINNLFTNIYSNAAGQYSMALFITIMAIISILQLSREYVAKAEESAKLLEEKVKEADAAKHEAIAANKAKGKFLAHMSHEIRTPINAVIGMDEMILRETTEPGIKEYAMDIYTAGQTLLSLVNDILDFSKIESGKMEIVPVEYDTVSLIYDLVNMALHRANGKDIKLETEAGPEIPSKLYGDDVRIRQVVTNILTNAIKYTQKGTVWLRIKSSMLSEDTVMLGFEVEDTGIGIKEEDLPKLFAEFERIEENRNRDIEGTGLGINITNQLLSLMGSRLEVESVYGKGSKFYFKLEQKVINSTPIGDFKEKVQKSAREYNYNSSFIAPDASILVVDDNAINLKVFNKLLKETKIQVTEADSGRKCLELIKETHYDLVFLDHMMPGMDGIETLHHIKELKDGPCYNTPVIVLTANAITGAEENYLSEGFDGFLSKPVIPGKLEAMLKEMLPEELVKEGIKSSTKDTKPETPGLPEGFFERFPQTIGIDWDYAWLHLPDEELLKYTIKEFYNQISTAADKLDKIYKDIAKEGQKEQYRIQIHAMKSLAASIGIIPLAGTAQILEQAAANDRTDLIMSMTEAFLEEWKSYKKKLKEIPGVETAGAGQKEAEDFNVIKALVEMTYTALMEMDIDKADQLITELNEYKYTGEINENIQKLAEAVNSLDLEETGRIASLFAQAQI